MLLQRHDALGRLPAIVALVFAGGTVAVLGYLLATVLGHRPLLLVADAVPQPALAPAVPDAAYERAFARGFLQDWATWTPYSYRHCVACALERLAPAARADLGRLTADAAPLCDSLQQSQSLALDQLTLEPRPDQRVAVRFRGRLTTYFGGVGGEPDPVAGTLLLHAVRPSGEAPRCLEIESFRFVPALEATAADDDAGAPAAAGSDPAPHLVASTARPGAAP
jgi:hypothetical protein